MKKLPVVLHIPHASRSIPEEFLPALLLDAAELETEPEAEPVAEPEP